MEEFVKGTSDLLERSEDGRDGGSDKAAGTRPEAKLLSTLEQLLHIDSMELDATLDRASDLIAGALQSEKVDTFLYDASRNSLVAGEPAAPLWGFCSTNWAWTGSPLSTLALKLVCSRQESPI